MIATTAYLIALLDERGADLAMASAALGVMGLGKVAGRLLLLGPIGRRSSTSLAAIATAIQLAGLALPLAVVRVAILFPAMFLVGAAAGATTVLRPLIVVQLVGAGPFAATNGRIQRASTIARRGAAAARRCGHDVRVANRVGRMPGRFRRCRRTLRGTRSNRPPLSQAAGSDAAHRQLDAHRVAAPARASSRANHRPKDSQCNETRTRTPASRTTRLTRRHPHRRRQLPKLPGSTRSGRWTDCSRPSRRAPSPTPDAVTEHSPPPSRR